MAAIVEKFLPDVTGEGRHGQVTLDTWFDRLMKALTVWLPLLVSGTLFLGGITGEPQNVFCHPPSNFSIPQANYLNAFCKESLGSVQITALLFQNYVLSFGLLMYLPHFLWKMLLGTRLASQIIFTTKEIEDIFRRLCDLASLLDKIDRSEDLSADQKTEKKNVARNHTIQSLSVLRSFVGNLAESERLWKFQIAKMISLVVFALACLAYLIWFDIVSQKDYTFVCVTKVSSSNINGTEVDNHIESVCKITGVRHLYHVSILLSLSFGVASPLPIVFILYIKLSKYIFLDNLLKKIALLAEHMTENKRIILPKLKAFSDLAIVGRLCGENRHLIPSLHTIINMAALQDQLTAEELQGALSSETRHAGAKNAMITGEKNVWVDFATSVGSTITVTNEDRRMVSARLGDNDDSMIRNRLGPGAQVERMESIETVQVPAVQETGFHPTDDILFHRQTDETRVKTLEDEETVPMSPASYNSDSSHTSAEETTVKGLQYEEESVQHTVSRSSSVGEDTQTSEHEDEKQKLLSEVEQESTV